MAASKIPSLKEESNAALNSARGKPITNSTDEHESGIKGWISWVLAPGIGDGVINFTRCCIFALLLFLSIMSMIRYNIHFIILTIITIILYLCFEFTIQELRKNPDVMAGKIPEKMIQEAEEKKKAEAQNSENKNQDSNENKEKTE